MVSFPRWRRPFGVAQHATIECGGERRGMSYNSPTSQSDEMALDGVWKGYATADGGAPGFMHDAFYDHAWAPFLDIRHFSVGS